MPSSSGTFSSRNKAVGQAQRERVIEKPQSTLFSSSAGLDLAETFFLLLCVAFASWHLFEQLFAHRESEKVTIKRRWASGCWPEEVLLFKLYFFLSLLSPSLHLRFCKMGAFERWKFLVLHRFTWIMRVSDSDSKLWVWVTWTNNFLQILKLFCFLLEVDCFSAHLIRLKWVGLWKRWCHTLLSTNQDLVPLETNS